MSVAQRVTPEELHALVVRGAKHTVFLTQSTGYQSPRGPVYLSAGLIDLSTFTGWPSKPVDVANPKDRLGVLKPRLSLVPPALTLHAAGAYELGATKYGRYNWREKKVKASIYIEASLRHLVRYLDGEELDTESNHHHLGHVAACVGILLDAMEGGNLIDDRPAKGPAGAIIDRMTKKP